MDENKFQLQYKTAENYSDTEKKVSMRDIFRMRRV